MLVSISDRTEPDQNRCDVQCHCNKFLLGTEPEADEGQRHLAQLSSCDLFTQQIIIVLIGDLFVPKG